MIKGSLDADEEEEEEDDEEVDWLFEELVSFKLTSWVDVDVVGI